MPPNTEIAVLAGCVPCPCPNPQLPNETATMPTAKSAEGSLNPCTRYPCRRAWTPITTAEPSRTASSQKEWTRAEANGRSTGIRRQWIAQISESPPPKRLSLLARLWSLQPCSTGHIISIILQESQGGDGFEDPHRNVELRVLRQFHLRSVSQKQSSGI